jgi:hypothetical protein
LAFGATLEIHSAGPIIDRKNVELAHSGHEIDRYYLSRLSEDAVPAMVDAYLHEEDRGIADELAAALACNAAYHHGYPRTSLRDFTFSRWRARKAWLSLQEDPSHKIPMARRNTLGGFSAQIRGAVFRCSKRWGRSPW